MSKKGVPLTGKNKIDKQIDKIKAYLFSILNSFLNILYEKMVIMRFKKEL